jgi:hypothetical protein
MVEVFSSQLVTKDNPNGKGLVDIDTPEGEAIVGGKAAADKIKHQKLIQAKMIENAEDQAIADLKGTGDLPTDYVKEN